MENVNSMSIGRSGRGRRAAFAAVLAIGVLAIAMPAAPASGQALESQIQLSGSGAEQGNPLSVFVAVFNPVVGGDPTGTVTVALYGPGDDSCSSPIFTDSLAYPDQFQAFFPTDATTPLGLYRWTATYSGDATFGPSSVSCAAGAQVELVQATVVEVSLAKSAQFVDTNGDGQPTAGDAVDYSFTITNTGNVQLSSFQLTDPMLGGVLACGTDATILQPNETLSCGPFSYVVQPADLGTTIENDATVAAIWLTEGVVETSDTASAAIELAVPPAPTTTSSPATPTTGPPATSTTSTTPPTPTSAPPPAPTDPPASPTTLPPIASGGETQQLPATR